MGAPFFHHDEAERRKWQNPEAILSEIGLSEGMVFVDVGSGPGFFALPASRIVGQKGKVYAIDADPRSIEKLEGRAQESRLNNVIVKAAQAEETTLFEEKADMIFFGIDLHDFTDPSKVLGNAMRMLKRGGKVVDLDWRKIPTSMGPPLWKRFTEEKASGLITDAGFKILSVARSGRYHYLIVAMKP